MMGIFGAKTKKELKTLVGTKPDFWETSLHGLEFKGDGKYVVVGPDPYEKRTWYATVFVTNGLISKVT